MHSRLTPGFSQVGVANPSCENSRASFPWGLYLGLPPTQPRWRPTIAHFAQKLGTTSWSTLNRLKGGFPVRKNRPNLAGSVTLANGVFASSGSEPRYPVPATLPCVVLRFCIVSLSSLAVSTVPPSIIVSTVPPSSKPLTLNLEH